MGFGDFIKEQFIDAFNTMSAKTSYGYAENSTSAITIKVVDKANSKIKHSCDFAIIYYDEDEIENGYYYLKYQKSQNSYKFEMRSTSRDIDSVLEYILDFDDGWNCVREEYLKLKNINRNPDKHSFSLYLEALHNTANYLSQFDDDDYDEYDDDDD